MKGIGVSPGIAIGKASVIRKKQTGFSGKTISNPDKEIERFDQAIADAIGQVEQLKVNTPQLTEDATAILETQTELLSDPEIREQVAEKISGEHKNASDALLDVITGFVELFSNMDDEYMRGRAADIKDIGDRVFNNLNGLVDSVYRFFETDTIIVAEDLSPSDTIALNLNLITGFATKIGSKTSHAAIIAKAKGLPAVVGCPNLLEHVIDGDTLILDGSEGLIYINPTQDLINEYTSKQDAFKAYSSKLKVLKDLPAITTDGTPITLLGNIGNADELVDVFDNGGEGAGLLRTELLFMGRNNLPGEEEQFEFYKKVALQAKGKPVIVRTLDIGGDKHLPYFNLPQELNPFLGYRAIRICLDQKELFITQLKAILRASAFGDLKIMFPMIAGLEELRHAKRILQQAKTELYNGNIQFNAALKTGIMIEVPSAAVSADLLAKEADFFSIGTNDLCQYTLAVDRMNDKVAHLYEPFNPGVLRLIHNVIEQGKKHRIHVGMCGEMAGDPLATLLLLGMGLRDFSMSSASIPAIKNTIIKTSEVKAGQVFNNVMQMDNATDIINYLKAVNE